MRLVAGVREREEQDRDAIGECRGNAWKGVLRPRAVLHHKYAGGLAVGHSGEPVGHVNADTLLPTDDRADAGGDRILDQRCRWEAEERGHALSLEDFNDGIRGSHPIFPRFFWTAASVGGVAVEGKLATRTGL